MIQYHAKRNPLSNESWQTIKKDFLLFAEKCDLVIANLLNLPDVILEENMRKDVKDNWQEWPCVIRHDKEYKDLMSQLFCWPSL